MLHRLTIDPSTDSPNCSVEDKPLTGYETKSSRMIRFSSTLSVGRYGTTSVAYLIFSLFSLLVEEAFTSENWIVSHSPACAQFNAEYNTSPRSGSTLLRRRTTWAESFPPYLLSMLASV